MDLEGAGAKEFLDRECADDAELRAEVEAFLEAESRASGFLEQSVADLAAGVVDEIVPRAATIPLAEGRSFGPYRLIRPIGCGGMGWVYLARDTRLGRQVALKVLPEDWNRESNAQARFQREARMASSLDDPHICTLHDIGEEDGRLFLVMAYYEGETLETRLARGALPADEARSIAVQTARGLAAAHRRGIVHRDIKPANLMLTLRGAVKILDFGIAKIADDAGITRTGLAPGTPAYMSPEQVSGKVADERSDLWSLGVVLYEMLSGARPFEAEGARATLFAILGSDPQPLSEWRSDLPTDLIDAVDQLLVKERDRRCASAGELLEMLGAGIGSTLTSVVTGSSGTAGQGPSDHRRRLRRDRGWARRWNLAAALGIIVALSLLWLLSGRAGWMGPGNGVDAPRGALSPAPATEPAGRVAEDPPRALHGERVSLAVLPFQNLTGEADLDWLRQGLPEMLATDLAQSPGLDVLDPGRTNAALEQLDVAAETLLAPDQVRQMAASAAVATVVIGTYVRLGEAFRVTFRVEEPASGEILTSSHVEGRGQESLFALVDEMGAAIRFRFELPAAEAPAKSLEAITTSSLEAWRLYTEALAMHRGSKTREALPLLERALELDGTFALAHAELGKMHLFLGHPSLAEENTRRAIELGSHLPLDQRYYLEANHAANRWSSYDQAIELFSEALEIYPEREAWRAYMAHLLASLERYDEAEVQYAQLLAAATQYTPTYVAAANVHAAQGREGRGYRLLSDYAQGKEGDWFAQLGLGWHLTTWGKVDEARKRLDRAAAARPGDPYVVSIRWRLETMAGNYDESQRLAQELIDMGDTYALWRGHVSAARTALFRGQVPEARSAFAAAMGQGTVGSDAPGAYTAMGRVFLAELLLALDRPRQAIAEAEAAERMGRGHWPEVLANSVAALAAQALGRSEEVKARLEHLAGRLRASPNRVEKRLLHHLRGRLALGRGSSSEALTELRAAADLLPARGVEIHEHVLPDHLQIWLDLGRALSMSGDLDTAQTYLLRVVESGSERVEAPLPWIQAHGELGRLHGLQGDEPSAAVWKDRFVALWPAQVRDPE